MVAFELFGSGSASGIIKFKSEKTRIEEIVKKEQAMHGKEW
jgi:hypothetical protein